MTKPVKYTKKQVLALFKATHPNYNQKDRMAVLTEWTFFTDQLNKQGSITNRQVNEWTNPFEYRK